MVTSIAGVTSPSRNQPYLSNAMFKLHRRRGVQTENLVAHGSPADQEAALAQYILAGSRWCDDIIDGHLGATVDTEQKHANVDNRGFVTVSPRFRPVLGLTSFSIGPSSDQLTALSSLAGTDVQEASISVPVYARALMTSSEGPIQFGSVAAPYDRALCRYTYVHGFPSTVITSDVAVGASSIAVADTTGIVANLTWLELHAGPNRHRFLVTSVSNADAGGLGTGPGTIGVSPVVPAAVSISDTWDPPMVSGLPATAIEAVVLATRGFIKEAPQGAGVPTKGGGKPSKAPTAGDDFAEAERLLRSYMVVTR